MNIPAAVTLRQNDHEEFLDRRPHKSCNAQPNGRSCVSAACWQDAVAHDDRERIRQLHRQWPVGEVEASDGLRNGMA